jgi:hypothetical protein
LYFEFLMLRGVRPTERFLDFGCGAGPLGIPMIRDLRPGHYFGIEPHQPSLQAFADYEIPLHRVGPTRRHGSGSTTPPIKRVRFSYGEKFRQPSSPG